MAFKLCEIGEHQKQHVSRARLLQPNVPHVSPEKTNSFAATERSFTVKMFTFQFFTLFSSLFYVAFFLGRYT